MLNPSFWLQDGEELVANENVKIVQHGARCSMTIVCSEGEDSGIYICYAHNDSGHACCEAQLTVEEGETYACFSFCTTFTKIIEVNGSQKATMNLIFCRSTWVSRKRGGAGQKKKTFLRLWCPWWDWKVSRKVAFFVQERIPSPMIMKRCVLKGNIWGGEACHSQKNGRSLRCQVSASAEQQSYPSISGEGPALPPGSSQDRLSAGFLLYQADAGSDLRNV